MSGTRLRILHLIPTLTGGGSEMQLSLIAGALATAGSEIHVGYVRGGVNLARLESSPGVALHRLASRGNYDPRLLLRIHRLIRRVRPDVLHTWLRSMDVLGGIAATANGVRWVLSERTSPDFYALAALRKDRLRLRLGRRAAAVLANSRAGAEYWRSQLGMRHSIYVPNALPLEDIRRAPALDRDTLGLRTELPLVVYAGRMAVEKNVRVLAEALIQVVAGGGAVALMCGDGPERAGVATRVAEAGVADRIRVERYRRDLWPLLKAADVTVSVSRYEGAPNVVMEAMACGCPLVVSDIGAHREILDARSAVFVNGDDAAAIATALNSVLSDGDAARTRAAAAVERSALLDVVPCALRFVEAYHTVLGRRHGRAGVAPVGSALSDVG